MKELENPWEKKPFPEVECSGDNLDVIYAKISFLWWILELTIINIFFSVSENKILSAGNNFIILKGS